MFGWLFLLSSCLDFVDLCSFLLLPNWLPFLYTACVLFFVKQYREAFLVKQYISCVDELH
jgi:hypothetical protein